MANRVCSSLKAYINLKNFSKSLVFEVKSYNDESCSYFSCVFNVFFCDGLRSGHSFVSRPRTSWDFWYCQLNCFDSKNRIFVLSVREGPSHIRYGKNYWISSNFQASWDQAKTLCKSYGLEFLSVDSWEESNHLLWLSCQKKDLFDKWTHIGGITSHPRSKTEWYWIESGEKLNFGLKWGAGQPDLFIPSELCLSLGKEHDNFFYNDIACYGYPAKFICQSKTFVSE